MEALLFRASMEQSRIRVARRHKVNIRLSPS